MNFPELLKRAEKLITDNSPGILTGIGVAGTIVTAYLAGKASFRAAEIIEEAESVNEILIRPLTPKEKVDLVWKLYIPTVGIGTATVICIIGANRVGARRAAAVAAAYSLTEKAFEEYRSKVIEKIGEKKEETIRADVAADRIRENPPSQLIVADSTSVICYEAFTGRYWTCDVETLRSAENEINRRIIHDNYASLSDFYELVGLPNTSVSDEIGWNLDKMLDLRFSSVLMEATQRPCLSVEFTTVPIRHHNY